MDEYTKNIATTGEQLTAADNNCETCGDPVLFAMQDNYHKFSLGLFEVLKCLRVAEQEGYLPDLPDSWWVSVENTYQLSLLTFNKD